MAAPDTPPADGDRFGRGRPPVLANIRYTDHAGELAAMTTSEAFDYIYRTNLWGSPESASGIGSQLDATATLRSQIPQLLRTLRARTLLDLPCGDFGWLQHADLGVDYIGADIVPDLVERNQQRYGNERRSFRTLDLTRDPLPQADVVLCRDCLVHLPHADIFAAFANLARSGAKYLLTTTFPELEANTDIPLGDWRPLNLRLAPFSLPEPAAVIVEDCDEEDGAYADKSLGLWQVADLPTRQ